MKKVLYISNIEVPYRVEFFNRLSERCDLTVLYERKKSSNRNDEWTKSSKSKYKIKYLKGINLKNEYTISLAILKYVFSKKYDKIIIGCYNSPSQMLAILILKLFRKKYFLNIDGEYFISGKSLKNQIKKFFLKGANIYLVAGEMSAQNIKKMTNSKNIYTYYFSSLTQKEIMQNKANKNINENDYILVVGQYFDYKGLDIALKAASINRSFKYKFIGMGARSDLFAKKVEETGKLDNVIIVPFLKKEDLYKEYQKCKMLVLPSRQECWGLVINEAASFGTPIVATEGSGAAIEIIKSSYPQFIAKACDQEDLYKKIETLDKCKNIEEYKEYLINKVQKYNIEHMVEIHIEAMNKE